MADRPQPISYAAPALVAALVVVPIGAVIWQAGGRVSLAPSDWAAIRFTLWQASLSALISTGLAIPVARALARRDFPLRGLLVTLLGAPFILPVIVAVLGLLAVFGRGGWVNAVLEALGLPTISIYGAYGVVFAHVFFNLPLATRLILQGWLAIPAERFRLAANLDLTPWAMFRILEWPMLCRVLPGAALVIFLLCISSFAVALALGGGPRATTVELAIYQAFRFDFDLARAAGLAVVQLGLTLAIGFVALSLTTAAAMGASLDRPLQRFDRQGWVLDVAWLTLATALLILPLAALVVRGIGALPDLPGLVWASAGRSLLVALGSTALMLALALPCARLAARAGGRIVQIMALSGLAASPLVIGTGLFILTFPIIDPAALALWVTALVNAVLALPFALRALAPAMIQTEQQFGKLADTLALTGFARWRYLLLPRLRRPIGFATGLGAALSMGDLGVVALFADADAATLPLHLYRLMAAYRMEDAAGAALLLLTLSLLLFWSFDRGGRIRAAT